MGASECYWQSLAVHRRWLEDSPLTRWESSSDLKEMWQETKGILGIPGRGKAGPKPLLNVFPWKQAHQSGRKWGGKVGSGRTIIRSRSLGQECPVGHCKRYMFSSGCLRKATGGWRENERHNFKGLTCFKSITLASCVINKSCVDRGLSRKTISDHVNLREKMMAGTRVAAIEVMGNGWILDIPEGRANGTCCGVGRERGKIKNNSKV